MRWIVFIWVFIFSALLFTLDAQSNLHISSKAKFIQESESYSNFDFRLEEDNITGHSEYGYSIALAGDLNSDGYDDIIVGAPKFGESQGRSYVYYGGEHIDTIADLILTGGEEQNIYFGCSVSSAGDINGDGYDDVVVGAYGNSSSYIFMGGKLMDSISDIIL
jgi:hypothetical protein